MALIFCPVCDKQISNHATSCPNCGHPITPARNPESTQVFILTEPKEEVLRKLITTVVAKSLVAGAITYFLGGSDLGPIQFTSGITAVFMAIFLFLAFYLICSLYVIALKIAYRLLPIYLFAIIIALVLCMIFFFGIVLAVEALSPTIYSLPFVGGILSGIFGLFLFFGALGYDIFRIIRVAKRKEE